MSSAAVQNYRVKICFGLKLNLHFLLTYKLKKTNLAKYIE